MSTRQFFWFYAICGCVGVLASFLVGPITLVLAVVFPGAFQAGVLNYQVYEARVKDGRTDPEVCRVIWKTPSFADYNITVRPDIDAVFGRGMTEKLTKAMLDMNDPALLASFGRSAIVPASNEDYAGLRKVAQDLGMLR